MLGERAALRERTLYLPVCGSAIVKSIKRLFTELSFYLAVCNPCRSSSLWVSITSLVFSIFFSGLLQLNGNFVVGQNNSN